MTLAALLLPDFSLIVLGALFRRILHLGDHFWRGVEKLVYFVLFPALLFNGLVRTRVDWPAALPLVGTALAALLGAALLAALARRLASSPRQFAALHQCAYRFNSYVGLALAGSLYGSAGVAVMAIVVGVMVPPANLLAVWLLSHHGEGKVLRELAKNPLILATLAGLLANVCGFEAPAPLLRLLARLGDAAVVLGLLSVGAGLRLGALRAAGQRAAGSRPDRAKETFGGTAPGPGKAAGAAAPHLAAAGDGVFIALVLGIKLLAMPALAWAGAAALHLPPLYADVVLLFAALPSASSAFILVQRMGGDGTRVAWAISLCTLLAMATLPLWLSLRTA